MKTYKIKINNQEFEVNQDDDGSFIKPDFLLAADGFGSALKPACEPISVCRKPLEKGLNISQNFLKWGVGGINIDGSRVEMIDREEYEKKQNSFANSKSTKGYGEFEASNPSTRINQQGRFPANLIHDGSEEVLELFPNESHRFFYTPKASKSERNMGLDGFEEKKPAVFEFRPTLETNRENWATPIDETPYGRGGKMKNNHPTVKPVKLMEYLVNLVSKEGHTVLDPFAGSGSTGIACKRLNREFIGIERDEEYCKIAEARINNL